MAMGSFTFSSTVRYGISWNDYPYVFTAQVSTLLTGEFINIKGVKQHPAAGRMIEAAQDGKQGGFPRA
jgi:hypothetical protein